MKKLSIILLLISLFSCKSPEQDPTLNISNPTCPCYPERKLERIIMYHFGDTTITEFTYGPDGLEKLISSNGWEETYTYNNGLLRTYKGFEQEGAVVWGLEISNDTIYSTRTAEGQTTRQFDKYLERGENRISYNFLESCFGGGVPESWAKTMVYDLRGNLKKVTLVSCGKTSTVFSEIQEDMANPFYSLRSSEFIPENGPNLSSSQTFGLLSLSSMIQIDITLDDQDFPVEMKHKTEDLRIVFFYQD